MLFSLKTSSGQALVGLLASATIGTILLAHMGRGILQTSKMERGVASNLEMTELITIFHMLTDSLDACSRSGLIGKNVGSLFQPTPIPTTLPISIGELSLEPGKLVGSTRKITGFSLTNLADIGNSNYIGTFILSTQVIGQVLTSRNNSQNFYLRLAIDQTNKTITECSGSQLIGTDKPGGMPKLAQEFSVPLNVLRQYNVLLTPNCARLLNGTDDAAGSWLFFASACRRYCAGCNPSILNCTGTILGKGYTTGYAAECNGNTNSGLCICVP